VQEVVLRVEIAPPMSNAFPSTKEKLPLNEFSS
jgi:hypothetical protein